MSLDDLLVEALATKVAEKVAGEIKTLAEQLARIEQRLPVQLASVDAAAEHLGVCRTTIQRLCRAGKLPATRKGRAWLVDLAKVRAVDADDVAEAAAEARGHTAGCK